MPPQLGPVTAWIAAALLLATAKSTTGSAASSVSAAGAASAAQPAAAVNMSASREVITLAGGCFWCIEACFNNLRGVESAVSGYLNGHVANPSYKAVCGGDTGHAEAVQVAFDPAVLPLEKVFKVFFTVHDPTTLNYQGNDYGTQYRSGIYYHTDAQRDAAQAYIRSIQPEYKAPIVTEVVPAQRFWPAEDYHQRYFEKNPDAGYCRAVVRPKVVKTREKFGELLK